MEGAKDRLFEAAVAGDTGVLEQLAVEHPADIIFNERNSEGDLASHVALQHGHLDFALKICSYFPSALYDTMDHMAAKPEHPEFFRLGARLLSQYFQDFSYENRKDKRREDAGEFRSRVLKSENKSLLHLAVENGYVDVAKLLLESLPKKVASMPYYSHMVKRNDSTPLHIATRDRNYDLVETILRHVSRHEVGTDSMGCVPLHYAVMLKDRTLVDRLLTYWSPGAEVQNNDGLTPFHLAARWDDSEIFQLFLRRSPHCWQRVTRTRQQNALHIAVEGNVESIISVIVKDMKISEMINQRDVDGNTPLHLAAYKDNEKLQNLLLASEVTVQPIRNNEGKTFIDITTSRKERRQNELQKKEKMQSKLVKGMEDFQSSMLVMATLIITVTFTAAFTLPGGYNGDQPNQGMATLAGRAGFAVFLVADTMSMCSSIVSSAALILFSLVFSTEKRFSTLKVAIGAMSVSIIFMLVAFTAGVWLTIASLRRWLAIFIAVITASIPLSLILLVAYIMLGSGTEDVGVLLLKKNESDQK